MSEREFETWLSLLSGMLRLNPTQRAELSQELRTHLEDRLDDLIASGLSRDEAVASALEEFGDAAGLAHHFSQVAHLSKRRRIMRWTYGTIAASTCAILVLATFWPQGNPNGPLAPNVVVSQEPGTGTADSGIAGPGAAAPDGLVSPVEHDARARIEAKLNQPLESVQFVDVPFSNLIQFLGSSLEIDFLVNQSAMADEGFNLDDPVTIELQHGKISTRTLLEIAFEQLGWNDCGYAIRDEIVYITSRGSILETVVYNCRDLFPVPTEGMGMPGGLGMGPAYPSGGSSTQLGPVPGMAPGAGMGNMGSSAPAPTNLAMQLITVVETTVEPDSWMRMGGSGNIQIFGGLMIVKNSQAVHREVKNLLDMMRKANEAGPPNAVGQPTSTGLMQGEVPPGSGSGFF